MRNKIMRKEKKTLKEQTQKRKSKKKIFQPKTQIQFHFVKMTSLITPESPLQMNDGCDQKRKKIYF